METGMPHDNAVQGAVGMAENSEGKPASAKKRHRNRKKSAKTAKDATAVNESGNTVPVETEKIPEKLVNHVRAQSKPKDCPLPPNGPQLCSSGQGHKERPTTADQHRKPEQKQPKQTESGAARKGSGKAPPVKTDLRCRDTDPGSGGRSSPLREPQPSPSGQRQREGQRRGNHRHKTDQNREKRPMFIPHWNREMVSAGLKKGFLVEGTIRINPKNYEDAYIPGSDGVSDIYISGFANRNRAMNGDCVAVLLNDRKDWRVFMDSLEEYEADLQNQMTALSLTGDDAKSAKISSVSGNSCTRPSGSEASVPNKTTLSHGACSGDQSTPSARQEICDILSSSNPGHASLSNNANGCPQGSSTHTPQKNIAGDNSPKKPHNQNRTPGSKSRYTSVKELLSQGSCSPAAKQLFSERRNGEEASDSDITRFVQKTGKVVAIIEAKHSRACSGHIKPMTDKRQNHALFCPMDHRCPRIMVPLSDCPPDLLERPEDHANTLYIARITDWPDTSQFAHGNLARSLGEAGQIEPETEGMLIEYDVDYSEFSPQVLTSLPSMSPWVVSPDELAKRKDFRGHCIFTIDPATARDLDDALSCEDLGNGLFEVGVHIADVTHFLQEDTELDKVASRRATSVYLVQKVVPMLPRLLCEELCSLNPDTDRLTFSVIWHMNQDAEIQGEWFGRSVIRSCAKMSYDHAQGFIENPEKEYSAEELPPITNGFSIAKIRQRVLNLHMLAQKMRKNRFDSGALRLDQVKLQFSLDKETGLPNGYTVYKQRESNKLVEEFMLLANMAVGHKILKAFPETALLRHHPPPQSKMLNDLYDLCINLEVPVDTSSSGALQRSLNEYQGDDEFSAARLQVLISLCSKPMQNARYFCTGVIQDEEQFHHYALNVPVYTHFTSPIRRYADVVVHRLLAASLGYCEAPNKSREKVQKQADHCNDKKLASKCVQERSSDMFFAVFVKEVGPLEEAAMVMAVLDRSFDVFVLKLGVIKRVYCDKLPLKSFNFHRDRKRACLTLVWDSTEHTPDPLTQEISIFTMVTAILQSDKEPLRWSASISHPDVLGEK